jgi:hypothetical protein
MNGARQKIDWEFIAILAIGFMIFCFAAWNPCPDWLARCKEVYEAAKDQE